MKITIKARFTNIILFEGESESTKHALIDAINKRADLRSANLRSADLRSANLSGANLYGADLSGANLYGANLYGANLRSADLYGANLRSADLRSANLSGANLRSADLYDVNLSGVNLSGVDLYDVNLYGEKLTLSPLQIQGLRWDVTITDKHIKIGCQLHTVKEWLSFTRKEISPMATQAWDWWKLNKDIILALVKNHIEDVIKYKKENGLE